MDSQVLLLPGWRDSGPAHWQSLWEQRDGFLRVQQHDWNRPLRGDWLIQLEEAILQADRPVVLVAHSLGCHLVASWAAHSSSTQCVQAALLVAPPDLGRADLQQALPSWVPYSRVRLPFAAQLVASSNDPYATPEFSAGLAMNWGVRYTDIGAAGHVNAESGHGDWPQGLELLEQIIQFSRAHSRV